MPTRFSLPILHRLSTLWRTLRFRLAAWNAIVVVLTAVVTLAGLRQGVQWTLLHELDQILMEDLDEILLAVRDLKSKRLTLLTDDLDRKATGHKHHGWFVRLLDGQGRVVWNNAEAPTDTPAFAGQAGSSPITIDGYRVVERKTSGNSNIAAVRVGASLGLLHEDMSRLDRLVMIAAGAVLIIAPPLGYWLARRAALTIGEIIDTAARLRPSHLEERLPIQGTGDELDHLATTVNGLLDRTAAYLRQRRDFLANAAHELRTPLAAIRSSVEVALGGDRSAREYQELLEDIIEEGTALEALVNQLLLLSETDADPLKTQTEPVAFDDIVSKSAEMFQGVAETRGISIDVEQLDGGVVLGNRQHLRQVVNNLIDNAVKYTPPGGHVRVRLRREYAPNRLTLTVADTGVGISPEDVPRVFERFFRADRSRSRESAASGTGLGLSICQAVIAAHHGEIHCESTPERGTTMIVQLPLQSA